MGRRSGEAGAEPELREYLLAQAQDLRRTYVGVALEDPELRDYTWTELSRPVDALASGGPYHFSRYQLPDHHPMRGLGKISDDLLLDADNVLTEASSRLDVRP